MKARELLTKNKKFIRYFILFNLLLLSIFIILVRVTWSGNYINLISKDFIFWSGALKHLFFLGGAWLFLDVLFMLWYYFTHKANQLYKR